MTYVKVEWSSTKCRISEIQVERPAAFIACFDDEVFTRKRSTWDELLVAERYLFCMLSLLKAREGSISARHVDNRILQAAD